eukprot:CAMPEP_0119123046 /NCGR_PEP_ID=MMETSP1310-20130426/3111_1 /TAXON_ID=464262 /ORGANISM="Genus nov. species nov., Strain RCC2339" /LENGTH=630 /DNA_ID=CAMNT_0007112789 /DNA_START=189 /DNA_END=2081 /DNA_ORIENTATION=+
MTSEWLVVVVVAAAASVGVVVGDVAPDATGWGPYEVVGSDYQYETRVRPNVLVDRATDLWGRLYRPADVSNLQDLPVVVIMHGNTGTCAKSILHNTTSLGLSCLYTERGKCPPGFEVVQSYIGYAYLAEPLASWGFVVVSINANRGITCGVGVAGDPSLNLARGRLTLRTLEMLYGWSSGYQETPTSIGADLYGKLALDNVGLVGHSRSGEGMRAAIAMYDESNSIWRQLVPGLRITGVFELAGSDGQSRGVYDAKGLPWVGLVCGCDGDDLELRDIHPYDRMIQTPHEQSDFFKAVYLVNGANHNYLNTEWKLSDSIACRGSADRIFRATDAASTAMRTVVLNAFLAFFRSTLAPTPNATLLQNFSPLYDTPASVAAVTVVSKSYVPSLARDDVLDVEGFLSPTGFSQQGQPEGLQGSVQTNHSRIFNSVGSYRHDQIFTSNLITWDTQGGFYEDSWAPLGESINASAFQALSFRLCQADDDVLNTAETTDFSIELRDGAGQLLGFPVRLSDVALVQGAFAPFSSYFLPSTTRTLGLNPTLQTIIVPFSWFGAAPPTSVRSLRLVFDEGTSGAVWLASIRFVRGLDLPTNMPSPHAQRETLIAPAATEDDLPPSLLPSRPPLSSSYSTY